MGTRKTGMRDQEPGTRNEGQGSRESGRQGPGTRYQEDGDQEDREQEDRNEGIFPLHSLTLVYLEKPEKMNRLGVIFIC
ncbi:MAG: hypothetical protein WCJ45_06845 [bacterium]